MCRCTNERGLKAVQDAASLIRGRACDSHLVCLSCVTHGLKVIHVLCDVLPVDV
jgi:hypothetical protein